MKSTSEGQHHMADLDSPVARHHIRELLRQLHEFEDEVGFEELGRVLPRLFELYLSEACEKGESVEEVADMGFVVVRGIEMITNMTSLRVNQHIRLNRHVLD